MPAITVPRENPKRASSKAFVPPWKAVQTASHQEVDEFSMSQRWVSQFSLQKGSMISSPSAQVTTGTPGKTRTIRTDGGARTAETMSPRAYGMRNLSSSFPRRRLPFGSGKTAMQGQIASQVLQSMQERSSQQYSEGNLFREPVVAGENKETADKIDAALMKSVHDVEKRLIRVQETVEGLVRGVGKYTSLATATAEDRERSEEGLVRRVTAAVADAVLRGLEENDTRRYRDTKRHMMADECGTTGKRHRPSNDASRRPPSAGSCM